MIKIIITIVCIVFIRLTGQSQGAEIIKTNQEAKGKEIIIEFSEGKAHNHPSFVFWIEDTLGNYLGSLFITRSVATGVFKHGEFHKGKWVPSDKNYPAALPFWSHKNSAADSEISKLDAVTGATPAGAFTLVTRTDENVPAVFCVFLEINQPWDWNHYWHNNLYPDDENYKSSCQPAVVYMARIDLEKNETVVNMTPVGHSHYSGNSGELFKNLETLTSALQIAGEVKVIVAN